MPTAAGGSWRTFVRLGAFAPAQVTYLMIGYSIVKELERLFASLPLVAEFFGSCKPTFSKIFSSPFREIKKRPLRLFPDAMSAKNKPDDFSLSAPDYL